MKKIITSCFYCTLLFLAGCQKNDTTTTLSANHIQKVKHQVNSTENNSLIGTWIVKKIEGDVFVKVSAEAPEIKAPMDILLGQKFIFDATNVTIEKDGQILKKSSYHTSPDGQTLLMPGYSGEDGLQFQLIDNQLVLKQKPEAYYTTLATQMNKTKEEAKQIYRIPNDIIITLTQ